MLEVVALSALTMFLSGVGNGAAGEMGKQLLLSTGALARRTMGRETPLPSDPEGWEALAAGVRTCLGRDHVQAAEWTSLVQSFPELATALLSGGGLPPATRSFTDRRGILRQLEREMTRRADGRPRVALLYGSPGAGTTAVALHFGALHRDYYEGREFYVDLRDSSGDHPLAPAAVLLRLLQAMGVDYDAIPPTESGREQLYRRITAGRRALVVVDHASSLAQVRSLIPSTPEVFLLVVVSGTPFPLQAERVKVPPLNGRYALEMLRNVAGREEIARVKPRVAGMLHQCAGNPFALYAAAMQLGTEDEADPDQTTVVAGGDPVRGTAQNACRRLRPETVRLCRLTALGGWPSVNALLAGAAAGVTEEEAARMLAEAAEVQLLDAPSDGRYQFRPEVRRYLEDTAGPEHGIAECSAAVARVLDLLLNRMLHAAHAVLPQSWRTMAAPAAGDPFGGEAEGLAVLAADVVNVARAVTVAVEYQHTTTALCLARALWSLQLKAGYYDEVLPALRVATRCAEEHSADKRMTAALHFQLAHCLGELGHRQEADQEARAAVACERAAGHVRGEASSVELLGLLSLNRWEYEAAYDRFVEAERLYQQIGLGQEGAEDLPRALALSQRHQGRALRGMDRLEESVRLLESATDFFAHRQEEKYNHARALTDLAEALHDAGENAEALAKIVKAEGLLPEEAVPHLRYLSRLRQRCEAIE